MGFSRQEYWSGLPFPSPGDLPDPGVEPGSPALEADALTSEPPGKIVTIKDTKVSIPWSQSLSLEGEEGASQPWCPPIPFGRKPQVDIPLTVQGAHWELGRCTKCDLHARLGSSHQDHAQSNALVQVPLLHGRRHADDAHQQQRGVLEVLARHLRRPGWVTPARPGAQPPSD